MLEARRFRHRPLLVSAVRCRDVLDATGPGREAGWRTLPAWIAEAYVRRIMVLWTSGIHLKVDYGETRAEPEDWILLDAAGELRVCQEHLFEGTYEPLES